jgi:hypothetical protein
MDFFFMMLAPEIVVVLAVAAIFIWGAMGKERI